MSEAEKMSERELRDRLEAAESLLRDVYDVITGGATISDGLLDRIRYRMSRGR